MSESTGSSRVTRQSAKAHTSTSRSAAATEAPSLKDIETLYKLTEVEDKVKKATEEYEQELHLKRLKEIKKRLQQAQKDNWRFRALIDVVVGDEVLDALHDVGIRELTVQCGSHTSQLLGAPVSNVPRTQVCKDIKVTLFDFKDSIANEMAQADLVIGHAGAGTCIETLSLRKPMIVVINETLMDNHQLELAEKLASDGHLLFTVPNNLATTIRDPKLFKLKRFPSPDPEKFSSFLDDLTGVHC
ncbi:UDP-N-acetyl glucosamine transferase subunit alg13 [Aphelenchoides avenae]|nr:UDP-N-acetyl glucosamine transferase subunit alg13 [Aphelenchus avenae]